MKAFMKIYLIISVLLVSSGSLFGQQTRLELGDKYFDQFDYRKAIRLYESMDNNQKTWQINARLGDCYYYTSRPETALKYYKLAIDGNKNINESYLLKYAMCLQSTGSENTDVIEAFQNYYDRIEP